MDGDELRPVQPGAGEVHRADKCEHILTLPHGSASASPRHSLPACVHVKVYNADMLLFPMCTNRVSLALQVQSQVLGERCPEVCPRGPPGINGTDVRRYTSSPGLG